MDAVLSLMWEESYGAVTIDDICRRANVRKGSFYYFYTSKSDLSVQALERMWESHRKMLDTVFSASVPPVERIRRRCDEAYRFQVEMVRERGHVLGCPLCSVGSELCAQDENVCGKVREILGSKRHYWETAIADAQRAGQIPPGDAADKARCAMAFFEGMIAQARLHNDVGLLESLADRMCEHLRVRLAEPAAV